MKYEWRKKEKAIYLPKAKPEVIDVPPFNYFTIDGKGNPNDPAFSRHIEALYGAAYTVRMSHKAGFAPPNYFQYTVYPLEGVWSISNEAKQHYEGVLDNNTLVYSLMIRQPDFVTEAFAKEAIDRALAKKKNELIAKIEFKAIQEGLCVQMLHNGRFDDEAKSFHEMERFCDANGLARASKKHREVYLSDFRKTEPDKLKTTLRFKVSEKSPKP